MIQTSEIRLISLWQPWATLIAAGLKQYETRPWHTRYRGKIAIHAAKRKVNRDEVLPILYATGGGGVDQAILERLKAAIEGELPYGAIVAIADMTACLQMYQNPIVSDSSSVYINACDQTPLERAVGNWQPGRYAHKYENIHPIAQPIPCKGHQGLRRIQDAGVLKAIDQQLAYTAEIEQQLMAVGGGAA